jgi:hypothetical protein
MKANNPLSIQFKGLDSQGDRECEGNEKTGPELRPSTSKVEESMFVLEENQ